MFKDFIGTVIALSPVAAFLAWNAGLLSNLPL